MKSLFMIISLVGALMTGCAGGSQKRSSPVSREQIQTHFDQGRYSEVIELCSQERVLETDLLLLRGRCYQKEGDSEAALGDFRTAREGAPDQALAYCFEANLLLSFGKVDAALETMHQAEMRLSSMRKSDRFYVRSVLGEAYLAKGDAESARDHLRKAVQVGEESPFQNPYALSITWHNLSQAEFELAAFRSARRSYEHYLQGKGRSGMEISPDDRYTEMTLRLLTGDIPGAQKISRELPENLRTHADALLVGDTLSVRELVESEKEKR
ncbi:MAG: hypothetical protein QF645_06335 [Planctomycetota bacterium]|jgi:tetratricopeptide (TPR) repeat protein|nr:hypothetical protein [Planctomycetota bacterium]